MGKWYPTKGTGVRLMRNKKHSAKAHKKRAQKRKEPFGGLAAFAVTNPGKKRGKVGIHKGRSFI